jgi:GDP-L-fucose synthase
MKILVTGGSGFVGKNVVEQLSEKHVIHAPSHKQLDLLDESAVQKYIEENDLDLVIHSAVKPGHRNAKDLEKNAYSNIRMFFNLARSLHDKQKMIFLGSGSVYDMRSYAPKMDEEYFDKHVPEDEMGFGKYVAAKYIDKVDNIIELRVFGVFGRYEDYAIRFISNAICKTLCDLPITIKQNRRFDYIYIDDLVNVMSYFIENGSAYKAYNVTPDNSIELYELAEMVRRISKKGLPINVAREGMGVEYSGNNARLRKEIPGLRFTNIEIAVQKLYNWYELNSERIDRNCLLVDK